MYNDDSHGMSKDKIRRYVCVATTIMGESQPVYDD